MQTESLISPPRTIMEVYRMLPEGTRAEVINSIMYMSPAPKTNHQRIIGKLFNKIFNFIERSTKGEAFISPCDVYLDEVANAVQPDIIYISEDQVSIIHEDGIHGVPDLLIEVLSPGNQENDIEIKKGLYEKFKVKEYWIVDPETGKSIGYWLQGTTFTELPQQTSKIKSVLLRQEFEF